MGKMVFLFSQELNPQLRPSDAHNICLTPLILLETYLVLFRAMNLSQTSCHLEIAFVFLMLVAWARRSATWCWKSVVGGGVVQKERADLSLF